MHPEEAVFITVLWPSRKSHSSSNQSRYVLDIDSRTMKWTPRVQAFVDEQRLVAHGACG